MILELLQQMEQRKVILVVLCDRLQLKELLDQYPIVKWDDFWPKIIFLTNVLNFSEENDQKSWRFLYHFLREPSLKINVNIYVMFMYILNTKQNIYLPLYFEMFPAKPDC